MNKIFRFVILLAVLCTCVLSGISTYQSEVLGIKDNTPTMFNPVYTGDGSGWKERIANGELKPFDFVSPILWTLGGVVLFVGYMLLFKQNLRKVPAFVPTHEQERKFRGKVIHRAIALTKFEVDKNDVLRIKIERIGEDQHLDYRKIEKELERSLNAQKVKGNLHQSGYAIYEGFASSDSFEIQKGNLIRIVESKNDSLVSDVNDRIRFESNNVTETEYIS